jgi:hypothetical protein
VQSVQHLEALADGFGVRAEALVWQGLPRLKLEHLAARVKGLQGGRGLFGFAAGGDNDQLKRGEFLRGAKIADCLDDAGLRANRGYDIGASICDFRLQRGKWVTLNCEVLKSFERDRCFFAASSSATRRARASEFVVLMGASLRWHRAID